MENAKKNPYGMWVYIITKSETKSETSISQVDSVLSDSIIIFYLLQSLNETEEKERAVFFQFRENSKKEKKNYIPSKRKKEKKHKKKDW